jgi:hypothetical protein
MLHVTTALVDFLMSLIWGGAAALGWLLGAMAASLVLVGSIFCGVRHALRRRADR